MASDNTYGVLIGSTSRSLPIVLRDASTSLPITGKVAADLSAAYWIQGGTPTAITPLSALSTISSAFTAKGVKEADSSLIPGAYRIDCPDAMWATTADWVVLCVFLTATGDLVYHERIPLTANVIQTGDAYARIGAAGAGLTALGDTRVAHLDADITSRTKPADTQAAVTLVATTTSLTNAPTAGDFTAAMKTSLNAATPASVSDKTGYGLADGAITEAKITLPTEATGTPAGALQLIMWIAGMFGWRKVVKDSGAGTIIQKMSDNTTTKTTSSFTSSAGVDTITKAS